MKIELTKEEKEVFDEIVEYSKTLDCNPVLRAAGGWVRDKILGRKSHDIDIALDTITGYDFALGFNIFRGVDVLKIGRIKSNPDQSKHLETAVLTVGPFSIDFVCLRNEEYATTRIPKIVLGTPIEDALRRDLTINALFYNLMTEEIEDLTNEGLKDLKDKLIKTPIEPLQTFIDDPLRILRVFRFSCQLNFRIHHTIYESLKDKKLSVFLKEKVSNERIGVEIHKIISTNDPLSTFIDFVEYNLYDPIFKPPKNIKILKEDLILYKNYSKEIFNHQPELEIFNLYYILIHYSGIEMNREYLNTIIVKENLKYNNKFTEKIFRIEKGIKYLKTKNLIFQDKGVIKLVRILGEYWRSILFFYILILKLNKEDSEEIFKMYQLILDKGFENTFNEKGIINGNDILLNLNLKKEEIKVALEEAVIYKILNPQSGKEEILKHLKEENRKLKK